MDNDAVTREHLAAVAVDNECALLSLFALYGIPRTMLDLGSGIGTMTKLARKIGVNAIGVDFLAESPDLAMDLTSGVNLNQEFDMVLCIEVVEHLDPRFNKNFVAMIAKHMHKQSKLVFTSALPGQSGNGHINCQPPIYWRSLFHDQGVSYRQDLTTPLALLWSHTAGALANWLPANLQVFDK